MSDDETSHLSDLSDGAGCTEIWEHLSEQRAAADAEDERDDADEDDETADSATSTEDEPENEAAGVPCP